MNWSIRIPILKNRVIRNQLSLAIGIPFGILLIVLLVVQAYSGLVMVGVALVLGFLLASKRAVERRWERRAAARSKATGAQQPSTA